VNHDILLSKLHSHGICGVSEDWFRSYLTNGRQEVEVKSHNTAQNCFSAWSTLKNGVPQGSIFGRLLFITYINDLPQRVNFVLELILFADVKISSRNFEDFSSVSNSVLSPMIKRFAANSLVLNLHKTIMMKLITKNSAHSSIQFGHKEKYIEETMIKNFLVYKLITT